MAILTRTAMYNLLRRIMESGGLTEDMEKDIQRIKDDFDEREGILKRYGETYDGEDTDEYEYAGRDSESVYTPDEENKINWEYEYKNLKEKYLNRFFGGGTETTPKAAIEAQTEDVVEDGEPKSFEELLEKVEV